MLLHNTVFTLSKNALFSLKEKVSIIADKNITTQKCFSLNNADCITCDQTNIMAWQNSIIEKEIRYSFPSFNVFHLRLLSKTDTPQFKKSKIVSDFTNNPTLLINLSEFSVTINFYKPSGHFRYYDNNRRMQHPNKLEIINSDTLLPDTWYLIDQSIPHNYETYGINQIKIFSASQRLVPPDGIEPPLLSS